MKTKIIVTLGMAIAAATTLAVTDAEAAKSKRTTCAMATGEGTGITEALARSNAATSLNNVVSKVKVKRTGPVKTTCTKSMAGLVTTCKSTQRFCQ